MMIAFIAGIELLFELLAINHVIAGRTFHKESVGHIPLLSLLDILLGTQKP
jgi:hypothetical protein